MADITFTIPNLKVQDFRNGILKHAPKPDIPIMTDDQWIKSLLLDVLKTWYREGKKQILQDKVINQFNLQDPGIDENIVS